MKIPTVEKIAAAITDDENRRRILGELIFGAIYLVIYVLLEGLIALLRMFMPNLDGMGNGMVICIRSIFNFMIIIELSRALINTIIEVWKSVFPKFKR